MFIKSLIVVLSIWQVIANSDTVLPPFDPTGLPGPSNVTTTLAPPTTTNNTTTTSTTTTTPTTTTTSTTTTTPTTTTTAKTSTTPAPKTTTAAPTPMPDNKLAINNYIGNYSDNNVCFMAKMAIQIQLPGNDKNSSTLINVPKTVTPTAGCHSANETSETLLIEWGINNTVFFEFYKNKTQYEIQFVSTSLLFPGTNTTTTYCHNKTEFAVPEKLSYYCVKDQKLNLTNCNDNVTVAELHLSHLHYQAFMNSAIPQYASVWNCDGANTSDVVPVVVGCVLAVLVVLVLVAYLVGRRRCQARGYLSM